MVRASPLDMSSLYYSFGAGNALQRNQLQQRYLDHRLLTAILSTSHDRHILRIKTMKPSVDNKMPKTMFVRADAKRITVSQG